MITLSELILWHEALAYQIGRSAFGYAKCRFFVAWDGMILKGIHGS